jgi:hypothetical protein
MSILKIKAFSIDSTDSFTFGNANITTTLNGNIANFTGNITSINANLGNLVVANYFSGNGSLLTSITGANVTGTVSSATTAGTVTTAAQGNITSVGTLTTLAIAGTGSITGANLVSANYITGTLTTAAQPNITSVGTLTGLTVNGDITSTGNLIVAGTTTYVNSTVTAIKDPIIDLGLGANAAALTSDDGMDRGSLLHYYTSGAIRDAFMGWKNSTGEFTFASNVTTTDNVVTVNTLGKIKAGDANLGNAVTSNYFVGNGSFLTGVTASSIDAANLTGTTLASGVVTSSLTTVGTLGSLAVTGNITAGNVAGGNLVSANYVSGNGSLLTSITGANVTGQVGNALVAGTVYTNAQPNITSVGTLTSITATGVINLTGTSNVSLGAVGNVKITGGTNGYVLSTDGSGNLAWIAAAVGSGNANVAGSNTQIFFNDGGSNTLGASANLTFDKTTNTLAATNITGTLTTASQPNITSVGTLTSVTVSGTTNLGAVGNLTITGGTNGYVLSTNGSGALAWIAQKTITSSVNEFTGDGTTVAFTLSIAPVSKNYTFASVQGVMQPKSSYSVTGTTFTFNTAPPNTSLIEITTLT